MTVPIARRNLFAEKGRFAISVAGVAFAVLLILIVLALYRGFSRTGQTFKLLPGDLWVTQQGTTDPFHSLSLLEAARIDAVRDVPGVAAAVPVLSRQMEFHVGEELSSARFLALDLPVGSAAPDNIRRDYLPPPGKVVIDRTLSRKTGLTAGDPLVIGGEGFIIDHVRPAAGESLQQFAFMQFGQADSGLLQQISDYLLDCVDGPGARPQQEPTNDQPRA